MPYQKVSIKFFLLVFGTIFLGLNFNIQSVSAVSSLDGRILLQVQANGEAWYVNPVDSRRYYLGRPDDAYRLMRTLGLGISNQDFITLSQSQGLTRLVGRILIKVEDLGRAYYYDPSNLKLYFLGRPDDAFRIMSQRGLGISNLDLSKILIAASSSPAPSSQTISPVAPTVNNSSSFVYNFKYNNLARQVSLDLSAVLYKEYASSPKVISYQVGHEPANLRESFYGLFLKVKSNDLSLDSLIYKLKAMAVQNNLSADETVALVMAYVQYIPYDQAKVNANVSSNNNPYYPYETLYLNKGVCSDKTFLAVVLLRKLGYGAAILDFPDLNHTAAGIECPVNDSINFSGYCYIETTNYFPIGIIPQNISGGQAQSETNEFTNLFNTASLGKIEILQKTKSLVYQGVALIKAKVESLKNEKDYLKNEEISINNSAAALKIKENALNDLKKEMDNYYNNGETALYNSSVANYNNLVNDYNADLAVYRLKIEDYNKRANIFYQASKDFYQQ